MKKAPVAVQLWSLRNECQNDFAATVAALSKMGYSGVELAGYGNLDVKGVKDAVEAAGLKVAGMHIGIRALRGDFETVITDALLLGTRDIICPWWPSEHYFSARSCEGIGEELDRIGAALRAYGIRLSFHNHDAEMRVVDGKTVMDWILGASQPRNLSFEPDVYWIQRGGQSPVDLLRRYVARSPLIHIKDEKEIGLGPVDFQSIFSVTDPIEAVEWYVVEQEAFSFAPFVSMEKNLAQLRAWAS